MADGRNVYVRGFGDHGLVFIDDLSPAVLDRMRADGAMPCYALESSPGSMQCWVRVSDEPIPHDLRTAIAQVLAEKYDGDAGAANGRQYGRLAGFTNQKRKRLVGGKGLYVQPLHVDHSGAVAPAGLLLIAAGLRRIADAKEAPKRLRDEANEARAVRVRSSMPRRTDRYATDPVGQYQQRADEVLRHISGPPNWSKIDFSIALAMMNDGAKDGFVDDAIRGGSPDLDKRHRGWIDGYVKKTIERARKKTNWAA